MSEITKVDTSKYKKEGKVEIDGNVWTVKLPGAGTELKMSKLQRRQDFLSKKVENGTATEADLDRFDEIEDWFFNFFKTLFNDGTKDNQAVNDWVENTPMAIILQAFEDIKEQANEADSTGTPSGS